jgi:hypothetical protein
LSDQGDVYSAFVESELAGEETRRTEINSQIRAAVTASGAQFGLATGLIVFVRGAKYLPNRSWSWLFGVSLALYLLSVAFGLVASRSHKTAVTSPATLRRMLSDHWTDDIVTARNFVARTRVNSIEALRQGNNQKTRWLKRSVIIQIGAVIFLAAAVLGSAR